MLRVAVVGCGGIGNTHARMYKADKLCELVAVCDILRDRADAAAQRHGVKAYYDVAEMLRSERLDAVSVASAGRDNGGDHHLPARQCLDAGLNVLVEKPISDDLEKAKVLGASSGLHRANVERALLSNPHGNGDEQTPVVVLKWRAQGPNPLFAAEARP